ncbi:nucleotidyltransferase family protein [Pseudomonas monteilii]|uniref:nucleotidyltransferase family protein n=1 Tax=Pseudomonas monteilii TaxID=76759 RepID=UPI003D96BE47
MRPSVAIQGRTLEIRRLVESSGFIDVRIFGSVCRGEDREGSDLDLLATIPDELNGKISLFDILDLEATLGELLGVAVDLNVENNMPEHFRREIDRSWIKL